MKKTIFFEIECGETTCASSPGVYCPMLRITINGKDRCRLFGRVYENEDAYIVRHKKCLELAKDIYNG